MSEIIRAFSTDVEASGLLNESVIDYTSIPYKLKKDESGEDLLKLHCFVLQDLDTKEIIAFYDGDVEYVFDGRKYEECDDKHTYVLENYEPVTYTRKYIKDIPEFFNSCGGRFKTVWHNGINYDLLLLKIKMGWDYHIAHDVGEDDLFLNLPCEVDDTLVLSKVINPDRYGGHSLDNLAKVSKAPTQKLEFRKSIPIEERFKTFAADMLYYNIYDTMATTHVYNWLKSQVVGWEWERAYTLEKKVAEIITRQEHRGFKFNSEKAIACVNELDKLIQEAKDKIEPLLPRKPMAKTKAKDYTLNANQFTKGTGEKSKLLLKFVDKHNGRWVDKEGNTIPHEEAKRVEMFGKVWKLPLPKGVPLVQYEPAEIKDVTHIKKWFVQDLGWIPLEWKDRDLTVRMTKTGKVKRNREEFEEAVDKYVTETINSPFCDHRLEIIGAQRNTLRKKLLDKGTGRSLKVPTNPSFVIGQEKEPCANLLKIADKFPHIMDLIHYLTYRHRRNTILGGEFDPEFLDEEYDAEPEKGYLAAVREDGRIPTPADTAGCGTSRMRHILVANVPRVSTLYGEEMREQFGVDENCVQIGYDFDSLIDSECKTC